MASRKKKKKRSPIQLFFSTIVFTIVFSFCVLAGGAFFAYQSFTAADKPRHRGDIKHTGKAAEEKRSDSIY